MLFIEGNDEVEPWFVGSSSKTTPFRSGVCKDDKAITKLKNEFRKHHKLSKETEVSHLRMVCDVDGCSEWATTSIETQFTIWPPDPRDLGLVPQAVDPAYLKQYTDRIGGRMVTCLCEKHHERLTKSLLERVFDLEERVDELVKVTEQMHDLFEYRSDLD